jgi:SagB-type dehydrogenase family enzyme
VVRNVDGIASGFYHYDGQRHQLELVRETAVERDEIIHWCGTQDYFGDAAVVIFYTSALERISWKYEGGRAYRLAFMDLGHLSQTMYLTATALNCGAVFSSALRDAAVERVIAAEDNGEIILGATALGLPTAEERERQDHMLRGGPAEFSFLPRSYSH